MRRTRDAGELISPGAALNHDWQAPEDKYPRNLALGGTT